MSDVMPNSASSIDSYLQSHGDRATIAQRGSVESLALVKSLAIRTLFALPLAFGLVCVSIWASRFGNTAKFQGAPGIMLGLVFGYAFGFGLAERANRFNFLVFILVGLLISAIVAGAIFGVQELAPGLVANAGSKRFWYAAGAFGGTTIMCAILALWHESRGTVLRG